MKKNILLDFIKKYSLGKTIEKCRWISNAKNKTLKTSVSSDAKNLLVDITLSNWEGFGDAEIGIGDTSKFKRELSGILGDDISFVINYNDAKTRIINIDVLDGENVGTFITSDLDTISPSSALKNTPKYDVEIIFDNDLKERFLKAKQALPDVDGFTVLMNKKGVLEMIVGYSNINSSRYSFKVKTNDKKDSVDEPLHFSGTFLQEILSANSECGDSTLFVSNAGIASIEFKTGDFICKYHLTSIDN